MRRYSPLGKGKGEGEGIKHPAMVETVFSFREGGKGEGGRYKTPCHGGDGILLYIRGQAQKAFFIIGWYVFGLGNT